jgi:hypothetical protein
MKPVKLLDQENLKLKHAMSAFPWHERESYVAWMAQHFRMVEHTMRMCELAAATARSEAEHDRWHHHLTEEKNHHKIMLHDARKIGADLLSYAVMPEVTAMVLSVQGGILLRGSHWLIGHAMVLEGLAVTSGKALAQAVSIHAPNRFVEVHVEEDGGEDGHYEDGLRYINEAPQKDAEDICQAILVTSKLYSQVLDGLKTQAQVGGIGASA